MAGAVSKPLFFGDALLPHCYWKSTNKVQKVPLRVRVKFSNEVASNDWKVFKLSTATGVDTIRHFGIEGYSSSYVLLPKRVNCLLNSSYTGTTLSRNTVISGYWMGPDNEDGWGYVEALVQRII